SHNGHARRGRDVKVHDAEAGVGDIAHLDLALRGGHRPGVAVAADRLRETGGPARQVFRLGEELERVPRGNVDLDALGIVSHDAAPLGFRVPLRFRPGPRAVVTADSNLT